MATRTPSLLPQWMTFGMFPHGELWSTLAHLDLKSRYRGSLLGPFWLTITTGTLIAGIGFLYGGLFNQPLDDYIPYIAVSIVLWTLISGCLTEGSAVYFTEGLILRQLPVPSSIFITRLIYRNILVFAHNVVIVFVVYFLYPPVWHAGLIWVPFGLVVLLVNLWWMCFIIGVLGARFRDFAPIVTSLVQMMFFLTPIIWSAESLPQRAFFINANPFYHLIEVVRGPLIAPGLPWTSIVVAVAMAGVGMTLAYFVAGFTKKKLVYWL